MSTPERFTALSKATILSRSTPRGACHPSILPVPAVQSGNNVSFSENKTKRKWRPSVKAFRWPVIILGGAEEKSKSIMPMMRMSTQIGRIRDYERAGGVEGVLVSTAAKDLSDYGKKMRSAVFYELHRLREDMELLEEAGRLGSPGQTKTSQTTARSAKRRIVGRDADVPRLVEGR